MNTTARPPQDIFERSDELRSLTPPHLVSETLQKGPIPTNEWYGNLLAWDSATQAKSDALFACPYTYNFEQGAFSISYLQHYRTDGPKNDNDAIKFYFYPPTLKNLTLSSEEFAHDRAGAGRGTTIDGWDDLGFTLTIKEGEKPADQQGWMRTYLALGNAFTTVQYHDLHAQLSSEHAFEFVNGAPCQDGQQYQGNEFIISLNNGQKWMMFLYPTSGSHGDQQTATVKVQGNTLVTPDKFTGIVQLAYISTAQHTNDLHDARVQELYQSTSGVFAKGATLKYSCDGMSFSYDWRLVNVRSSGAHEYLHFMLEHLHQLMDRSSAQYHEELSLRANTRGAMHAYTVSADSSHWKFKIPQSARDIVDRCTDFYPQNGNLSPEDVSNLKLCRILQDEVHGDWNQAIPHEGSYYFKGKALQKFGTMCLLAKRLGDSTNPEMKDVAQTGIDKLRSLMEAFVQNKSAYPLVYDTVYKGIVTSEAVVKKDPNADFGNGTYNDHHYHYGYLIAAAAILLYLDPEWSKTTQGAKLMAFTDTLIRDVMNANVDDEYFPRFRNFCFYLGHSYSHGVTPMADGKDEESTSEEANFYYGVALYARVTQNQKLSDLAKLMLSVNTLGINTYVFLCDDNKIHPPEFVKNCLTGIYFDNKCDYATWFSPNKECIHGIQMLPVSPVTDAVRPARFVKQEWDRVLSKLPFVQDWKAHQSGWTSLLFANYSAVDKRKACEVLLECPMDDGLSRAWALYLAHTRMPSEIGF